MPNNTTKKTKKTTNTNSKNKRLGKGLDAILGGDITTLIDDIENNTPASKQVLVSLDEIRPNPYQPRKKFDDTALAELADSIKEHGVFQPIIVKKSIKGYEIIAGERRVRASKLAGKTTIPAIIRAFTDEQMMEIALLENLQRENLSSIEEAEAYKTMIEHLNLTQDLLAKKIGKSRSYITNMLGLLRLPKEVQTLIINNDLSMGHARVLSKLEDTNKIILLANKVVSEKLSVRDLERIADNPDYMRVNKVKREKHVNSEFKYVEDMLREKLDAKVKIKGHKIEISFTNVADLNRILEVLNVKE